MLLGLVRRYPWAMLQGGMHAQCAACLASFPEVLPLRALHAGNMPLGMIGWDHKGSMQQAKLLHINKPAQMPTEHCAIANKNGVCTKW